MGSKCSSSSADYFEERAIPDRDTSIKKDKSVAMQNTSEVSSSKPTSTPQTEDEIDFLIRSIKYGNLLNFTHDETTLRSVVQIMKKWTVKAGEVVIKQGDTDNVRSYYVLANGAIDVLVYDHLRATLKPGCVFGELSFVFGAPRSASCIAKEDSVLWVLDRDLFDRVCSGMGAFDMKIVRLNSDPEDENDAEDEALSELALTQVYGFGFFQEQTVRDLSAKFLGYIASQKYVSLPAEIQNVMKHFAVVGTDLKYDVEEKTVVDDKQL